MLRVAGAAICGCLIASAVVVSLGQAQGQNQTPGGQAQGQPPAQAQRPRTRPQPRGACRGRYAADRQQSRVREVENGTIELGPLGKG